MSTVNCGAMFYDKRLNSDIERFKQRAEFILKLNSLHNGLVSSK